MRKFAGIIESTTVAPPTNYLWIKGNDALYFTNGKWVSLLTEDSADRIELETKVDDLDKEVGQIKKDLKLSDRIYKCDCGYAEDRDYNASLNLRDSKIYKLAQ